MGTLAFVMDPLERVNIATDTSFALMLEAHQRGLRVLYVKPEELGLDHDRTVFWGQPVELRAKQGDHFTAHEKIRVQATDCTAIFIRTDPPFNDAYLTNTWILSFAEDAGVRVINSPRGLRNANEHLYSLRFPEVCPRTLISSVRSDIRKFVEEVGGWAIGKPIDGHGGYGVVKLGAEDSNFGALVDMLTAEGKQQIMVQEFVTGDEPGDRRIFLVNGKLEGAIRRIPPKGDHRGNIHVGGSAAPAEPTEGDRRIAQLLGPQLVKDGLYFAGLDVIGDKLIEINVTSPTLVQELRNLGGPDLAKLVIDSLDE